MTTNQTTILNDLKQVLGLTPAQASGVAGNLFAESGFNPTEFGDNGSSFGLAQWHNSRNVALEQWDTAHGLDDTTLEGQLAYLNYDLTHGHSSTLAALKKTSTPQAAAESFMQTYEMPANQSVEGPKRAGYAETLASGATLSGITSKGSGNSGSESWWQKLQGYAAGAGMFAPPDVPGVSSTPVQQGTKGAISAAESVPNFLDMITSDLKSASFWTRVGLAVGGFVIVLIAIAAVAAGTERKGAQVVLGESKGSGSSSVIGGE